MSESEKRSEIPHELRGKITAFDSALNKIENEFEPLLKVSQIELNTKLNTLDKAKLDLVAAYSINSLFWMYLNVCGVNPKDHGIKQELERIRSYMNRVKEIQDKEKAPKLDVKASKRFVKSALWQAAQNQGKQQSEVIEVDKEDSEDTETVPNVKGKRSVDKSDNTGSDVTEAKIRRKQSGRYMNFDTEKATRKK